MPLDPKEVARKRFEEAIKNKKNNDEKADAVIWAAVAINAGLGVVPLGINIWTFVAVATVMVVWLGTIYGHHLSNDGAAKLIRQIFMSAGLTYGVSIFGLKFFAEVLKGTGVFTMGGTTAAGMALDAVLGGAVTYAVGFTTKEYFKKGQKMSKEEMKQQFKARMEEGKSKVKEQTSKHGENA